MPVAGGDRMQQVLDNIAKRLDSGKEVQVGFLEGSTYPDGTSVPMVAAIQNFGAPAKGIPPRPFFTNMVKEKSPGWGKKLSRALAAADYDANVALGRMGEGIKGELQASIRKTSEPALSPVTLLLRERFGNRPEEITFADVQRARADVASGVVPNVTSTQAKPLIWTGHLENSADYEVKS